MKIINAIKGWFSRKEKDSVLELKRVAEVFGSLDKLQSCGVIQWQEREKRLFLAEPLAVVQLRSREAWDAFMQNVMMWALYKRQSEAWERCALAAEAAAVRKVKSEKRKVKSAISDMELTMVRQSAREKVSEGAVKVPKVDGFEVFIVGTSGDQSPDTTPKVIAVGRYDVDRGVTDMVMWEEVASEVKSEK